MRSCACDVIVHNGSRDVRSITDGRQRMSGDRARSGQVPSSTGTTSFPAHSTHSTAAGERRAYRGGRRWPGGLLVGGPGINDSDCGDW